MSGKNDFACGGLASNGTAYQSDNAAMRLAANNCQFTKILVKRHEDALLVACSGKDRSVTWIGRPAAGPDNIVPGRPQHVRRLS
jgi:hypothetical protein